MIGSETSNRGGQASATSELKDSAFPPPLPTKIEELHIPFANLTAFWRPRHFIKSRMSGQIPFFFWLLGAVRPRISLQSGIGDGAIYLALCQAMERLSDDCICFGVCADESSMSPLMREQHEQYSDFSELYHGGLANAVDRFDGEIDLLILNEVINAGEVAELQKSVLPRLSNRALILVCQPDVTFQDSSVRASLFPTQGNPIVIAPVSADGQAIEVILYGDTQADQLGLLKDLLPGRSAHLVARQIFRRLGQGIEAVQEVDDLRKERDQLTALLKLAQEQDENTLSDISADADAARAAEAAEVSKNAVLLSKLYDLERELSTKERESNAFMSENVQLQSQLARQRAEYEAKLVTFTTQIETLAGEKAEAADQISARDEEISMLRRKISVLEAEIESLKGDVKLAQAAHEDRISDIVALTREFEEKKEDMQSKSNEILSKFASVEQRIPSIYLEIGLEIGRLVNALLPKKKSGLWKKDIPLVDRAGLLVANRIVDPEWYLDQNPDVAAAGMDAAVHYVLHGAEEGRLPRRIKANGSL